MKKQVQIIILSIIMLLVGTLTVNAADATVTLKASKTQLYQGDEFNITFSAECNTEFEGIDSNLIYDKDKLEFIEVDNANSNWSVMDEDLSDVQDSNYDRNIAAYCNQAKAKDDIFVITFKVKETAAINTTAKVSLNGIALYDVNDQTYDIGTKKIEVSIVEETTDLNPGQTPGDDEGAEPGEDFQLTGISITKTPTKTTYTEGEKFDKTGMEVQHLIEASP